MMLKLSNVSIAYNDKVVLDSLDLTADKGKSSVLQRQMEQVRRRCSM